MTMKHPLTLAEVDAALAMLERQRKALAQRDMKPVYRVTYRGVGVPDVEEFMVKEEPDGRFSDVHGYHWHHGEVFRTPEGAVAAELERMALRLDETKLLMERLNDLLPEKAPTFRDTAYRDLVNDFHNLPMSVMRQILTGLDLKTPWGGSHDSLSTLSVFTEIREDGKIEAFALAVAAAKKPSRAGS